MRLQQRLRRLQRVRCVERSRLEELGVRQFGEDGLAGRLDAVGHYLDVGGRQEADLCRAAELILDVLGGVGAEQRASIAIGPFDEAVFSLDAVGIGDEECLLIMHLGDDGCHGVGVECEHDQRIKPLREPGVDLGQLLLRIHAREALEDVVAPLFGLGQCGVHEALEVVSGAIRMRDGDALAILRQRRQPNRRDTGNGDARSRHFEKIATCQVARCLGPHASSSIHNWPFPVDAS